MRVYFIQGKHTGYSSVCEILEEAIPVLISGQIVPINVSPKNPS